MTFLKNRPLATASFLFLCSLTIASLTDIATRFLLFALFVFFAFFLFLLRKWRRLFGFRPRFLALLLAVAASAQLFGFFVYDLPLSRAEAWKDKPITVSGYAEDIYYTADYGVSFLFLGETVNGEAVHLRFAVTIDAPFPDLSVGDRLTVTGICTSLAGARFDGDDKYRLADGAIGCLETEEAPLRIEGKNPRLQLRRELLSLRTRMQERILSATDGDAGALMSAMLLGTRDALPDTLSRDFRRLGISHVLALSGLHLNIIAAIFHFLAARVGLGRKSELIGSLLLLIFYILLTGFTPSVLRAGIMAAAVSLSFIAAREADSVTSLFLAVTLILLFSPNAIYDPSFWLSFVATLGILAYAEHRKKKDETKGFRRVVKAVLSSFLIGFSAFLATLAASALFFGEIAWASPLSNLLLLPLFSLFLILSPFVLLFGNLLSFGSIVSLYGNALIALVKKGATLPQLLQDVRYPVLLFVLLVGTLTLFLYLSFFRTDKKRLLMAVSLFLGISFLVFSISAYPFGREKSLGYTALPAGDLLLFSAENKVLLYDASRGGYATVEGAEELLALSHKTELAGYMLSHYHARHVTTLKQLLRSVRIEVLYLPTPENEEEAEIYYALAAVAEEDGILISLYAPFEEFTFADLRFTSHKGLRPGGEQHKALGLTVRDESTVISYLGRGMNETDAGMITAASAVEISDILIFGTHGPLETRKIGYPVFKNELRLVLISDAERLHPALIPILEDRGVLEEPSAPVKILLD